MGLNFNTIECEAIFVNEEICEKVIVNKIAVYDKGSAYFAWDEEQFISQLISEFNATKSADDGYTYTTADCDNKKIFNDMIFEENAAYSIVLYGRCTNPNSTTTNMKIVYTDGTVGFMSSFEKKGENSYMRFTTPMDKTVKCLIGYWNTYGNVLYPSKCSITKVN